MLTSSILLKQILMTLGFVAILIVIAVIYLFNLIKKQKVLANNYKLYIEGLKKPEKYFSGRYFLYIIIGLISTIGYLYIDLRYNGKLSRSLDTEIFQFTVLLLTQLFFATILAFNFKKVKMDFSKFLKKSISEASPAKFEELKKKMANNNPMNLPILFMSISIIVQAIIHFVNK